MKRPFVAVVSCYTIGLLLAGIFRPPLVALFGIAFAIFVLACRAEASARRQVLVLEKLRPLLLWLLIAFAGWTNLASRTAMVSPNDLRALLGDTNAIVTMRGTLIETPHLRITERDGQQTERSVAQVQVTALCRDANWRPAAGSIIVTTPGTLAASFFAGQPVEVTGVISQPASPLAGGLFDYRDYLQTRGIFYQLKTSSTNDWQLGAAPLIKPPLTDRFLNWSQRTLALGLPAEDQPLRLLWAMTLGWRTALTADISEPFLRAGTMHLFAIDGLRIALISGMLVALLRLLQVSRAWCGVVAIPAIWFYTAATGWESSAIRASVMMTVVLGGWALKRPGDTVNSLAAEDDGHHHRRADGGGFPARGGGIKPDDRNRDDAAPGARNLQYAQQGDEHPRNQRNAQPVNREEMHRAGAQKGFADVGRERGSPAERHRPKQTQRLVFSRQTQRQCAFDQSKNRSVNGGFDNGDAPSRQSLVELVLSW